MKIKEFNIKGHKVRETYLEVYTSEKAKWGKGWFEVTEKQLQEIEDLLHRLEPTQVLQGLRSIKALVRRREHAKGKDWGRPNKVKEISKKILQDLQYYQRICDGEWRKMLKDIRETDKNFTKEKLLILVKEQTQKRIKELLNVSYPTKKKIRILVNTSIPPAIKDVSILEGIL